jgi:hypothetical protein
MWFARQQIHVKLHFPQRQPAERLNKTALPDLFAVPEISHHRLAVTPVFLDLDPGLQKDFRPHKPFDILPGKLSEFFSAWHRFSR